MYDVIIVGASFAGLAVASQLRGRVLLIDRKPPGEEQTSACATSLSLVLRLAGPEPVLQVHRDAYLHFSRLVLKYPLSLPMCSFDYRAFCQSLFRRTRAEFLQAEVRGLEGEGVASDQGLFCGRCIVDASGWRSVLAGSMSQGIRRRQKLGFALECQAPAPGSGLHFWLDEGKKTGYGWQFPCGKYSRVGWGQYGRPEGVRNRLAGFVREMGLPLGPVHGGPVCYGLCQPAQGDVFVTGDAAGQCLPLTGEGIRSAVYFGQHCGNIVQGIIDGRLTRQEGAEHYRRLVANHRARYLLLDAIQGGIGRTPLPCLRLMAWLAAVSPLGRKTLARYLRAFPTLPVASGAAVRPGSEAPREMPDYLPWNDGRETKTTERNLI